MNMDDVQIGEQIRYYRTRAGISQEALALMAEVNPAYVGQIERGLKSPTINTVKKIANALGISLASLFSPIPDSAVQESEIRKHAMEKIMLSLGRLNDSELVLFSQTISDIVNFRKLP